MSATAGTGVGDGVAGARPPSGGPVSDYTVTPYIGSEAQTATTVSGHPAGDAAPRSPG